MQRVVRRQKAGMLFGSYRIIPILAVISVGCLFLTGLTFANWIDSHQALQKFDSQLLSVEQLADPHEFAVTLTLRNNGDTPTMIEFLGAGIYHGEKLIAGYEWFPDHFEIGPQQERQLTFEVNSGLDQQHLVNLTKSRDWEAVLRLRVSHPIRDDAIVIQQRTSLTE